MEHRLLEIVQLVAFVRVQYMIVAFVLVQHMIVEIVQLVAFVLVQHRIVEFEQFAVQVEKVLLVVHNLMQQVLHKFDLIHVNLDQYILLRSIGYCLNQTICYRVHRKQF